MNNPWLIPVATLLLGGVAGFVAGSGNRDSGSGEVDAASSLVTKTSRAADPVGSSASGLTRRSRSLEEIHRQPGQVGRVQAMIDFYDSLTPDEFAGEADKLENLPTSERIMAAYLLFAKWAEVAPMEAMAHTNKMGFTGMFVKPTVLQSWASVDPANAAAYYRENPREFAMMGRFGRGGRGQSGSAIIAGEWAKQDPQAALSWANSLKGTDRTEAANGVVKQVAQDDPKAAAALAATLPADEQGEAIESIARAWGAKNWSEAEAWINSLPADQRAEAMSEGLRGLASSDPELAASRLSALPEGRERDQAAETIAQELGKNNPAAGIDWVLSQGSPQAQEDAIRPLMMNYARTDDAGARALLDRLPQGEVRDRAVSTYVFSNVRSTPQETIALAETIGSDRTRQRALRMTARRWMNENPAEAQQWIQETESLSDREKRRLLGN